MTSRKMIQVAGMGLLGVLVCARWIPQGVTQNSAVANQQQSRDLKTAPQQSAISNRWWFFLEESRIDRRVYELSLLHHPQTFAIVHATVIPMTGDEVLN